MAILIEQDLKALNDMLLCIEGSPDKAEDIKREFLRNITKSEHDKTVNILATMLSKIYDFDHNALKADMAKIIILDTEKVPDENERADILQCIMSVVDYFVKGDYSPLLNYIDSLCWDEEDYDYADLPYT